MALEIVLDIIVNNDVFGYQNELKLVSHHSHALPPNQNLLTRHDWEYEHKMNEMIPEELAGKFSLH